MATVRDYFVGWGSGSRLFAPARTMATPESKRGPNRLYAFKLVARFHFRLRTLTFAGAKTAPNKK